MHKMLKISSFELFKVKLLYLRYASKYSNAIFCSTVVKVRLLWPVSHIFKVVCIKFYYFKNFNSWKMLKMLKIFCFQQNYCLRYDSRYSNAIFNQHTMMKLRLLWMVSHIFTVVSCKFFYFKNFNSWKMLKMLKIGCFNQNYCISGTPQGTPMQFFPQQWWKSGYCNQFHTYSQWFAANFILSKISIAGKSSKCLK